MAKERSDCRSEVRAEGKEDLRQVVIQKKKNDEFEQPGGGRKKTGCGQDGSGAGAPKKTKDWAAWAGEKMGRHRRKKKHLAMRGPSSQKARNISYQGAP